MSRPVHSSVDTGAGVEEVFALLTSQRWVERRAQELRDGSRLVRRQEQPDDRLLLEVSRELPAGAPGFLERFLPRDGRVIQTEEWGPSVDGARAGTWHVQLPGAPARLAGTMRLEPTPPGSRYVLDGQVAVKVPVVGGRAETFIAEMLDKLAGKEATLLRGVLGE